MIRYIKRTIGLAAFVIALTASPAAWAQDKPDWLLVIQGKIVDASANELTLSGIENGIAFSDRPERLVRIVDIPALIGSEWSPDGNFRTDPPNASLIAAGEQSAAIVEITDAKQTGDELQFSIKLLEGNAPNIGSSVALTIDFTAINAEFTIP